MSLDFLAKRTLWTSCFLVLALLCNGLQADGPTRGFGSIPRVNTLSDVFGLGALLSINEDHELRRKLEITDEQLADIRETLQSVSLGIEGRTALESAPRTYPNLRGGSRTALESESRTYLNKVLTKAQADKIRIIYVNARFRYPDRLFEPLILHELEVEPEQVRKLYTAMRIQTEEVDTKLDKLITQAISDAFPPETQDILWSFVGSNFKINTNGSDWRKIAVLPQTNPIGQLTLGTLISIPNELALSQQQQMKMNDLLDELSAKAVTGNRSSAVEVSNRLDDILSNRQRFAIAQKIQQDMIRSNLTLAVCPEMARHFHLSDDDLNSIKAELEEANKQIMEVKSTCLLEATKTILKTAPPQVQDRILGLTDGIWDLN